MYIKNLSKIILLAICLFVFKPAKSQEIGMSFSFFFPQNGYFSTPISPFSIRGIGIHPTNFFSIETGFSLYRMSGMNVINLPFDSKEPLMGPFFSIMVPLEGVLEAQIRNLIFRVKGGGFGFYNFGNHVNYGNFDREIRAYYNWDVANSTLEYDNKIGYGFLVGGEIILYFTKKFGMNFEVNYLSGGSNLNYRGTAIGGTIENGIGEVPLVYPEARLDFTGWEITIGVLYNTK